MRFVQWQRCMAACLHHSLSEGASVHTESMYHSYMCGLCQTCIYETKLSCNECDKSVCKNCFPHYQNIQLALFLKTRKGLSGLSRNYKEFPESADTLFADDAYKTCIFRVHKEMLVANAELNLTHAKLELDKANECIRLAREANIQ